MKAGFEDSAGRILGQIRRRRAGVLIYGVRFVVERQMKGFRVPTDAVRDVSKWSFGNSPSDSAEKRAVEHSDLLTACLGQFWWASLVPNQVNRMELHHGGARVNGEGRMRPGGERETGESCIKAFLRGAQMLAFVTKHQKQVEFPKQCLWEWALLFWGFCFVLLKSVCHILHISLFRNFWFQKIK